VVALENVDLFVAENEFVSFIGPSGCGKSTLLEIIAGLQAPSEGSISIDGRPITGPGADRCVVFQQYALFPWRSVLRNVTFGLEGRGIRRKEQEERAKACLELVGLGGFEQSYTWQLSGGMRQRVAIARALAVDPPIMLMDEPFGALDAITRDLLQDQLLSLRASAKKTIIFVTHSVDEALYLSDRVVLMGIRPGRVIQEFRVELDHSLDRESLRASPKYQELHAKLWSMLSQELVRGAEEPQPSAA
jgi:NitT/TauT family transport system ATP-binding protein